MKRRAFLTGLLPSFSVLGHDPNTVSQPVANMVFMHGNLLQNFKYIGASDLCGKLRCRRTLDEVKKKNEFGQYYGNCKDYNVLLTSMFLTKTKEHIQSVYCYQNNSAHVVCYHPSSQLVFDNWLLLPKKLSDRTDIAQPRILWDSKIDRWDNLTYYHW